MTKTKSEKNAAGLIDPDNVSTTYLAELLALTTQSISNLASTRVIRTNGRRGKYDLLHAIPAYVGSLRGSGPAEAKAKYAVQQERKLRLQNDQAAGELVKIADAAEVYRQGCLAWRAGANALPRRLATMLANETDPAKIQRALSREFSELFTAMESPLRNYFDNAGVPFVIVETGANGVDTPANKNARPMGRRKKNTTVGKRRTGKVAKR